jgi:hypothetical protein
MSKTTKVLLIIAGALILVGGILSGAGFGLGGMQPARLTESGLVVTERLSGASIAVDERWERLTGINIDVDLLELRLEEGDSFSLEGTYNPDVMTLDVSESGGTLTIHSRSQNDWWWNFGFGEVRRATNMVLTYPRDTEFKEVSVRIGLGDLRVNHLSTERLNISLDAGNFIGKELATETLELGMSLGNCELDGLTVTDKAEMVLNSGSLRLDGAAIENLTSVNDLGNFDFSGVLSGEANIDMRLGSLIVDVEVPEDEIAYRIESDMGSATLNGHALGSVTSKRATSPKLTLDISSDLGSVTIRTD